MQFYMQFYTVGLFHQILTKRLHEGHAYKSPHFFRTYSNSLCLSNSFFTTLDKLFFYKKTRNVNINSAAPYLIIVRPSNRYRIVTSITGLPAIVLGLYDPSPTAPVVQ